MYTVGNIHRINPVSLVEDLLEAAAVLEAPGRRHVPPLVAGRGTELSHLLLKLEKYPQLHKISVGQI